MEKSIDYKIRKMYAFDSRKVHNQTKFDYNTGSPGYGETGFDSIEAIVHNFQDKFNSSTVFYDLGSGTGKIVYHVGLLHDVKKSCGIEYSKERHELSLSIKETYDLPDSKNVILLNENILDCDISDATVIYCDNTLFPNNINESIYKKIPKGCLVISRQQFKESKLNAELLKKHFSCFTEYGTNTLYIFIKS
jgi:hypothetical protein